MQYGQGLDGVVRNRADRLSGILNGADYSAWSPERDKVIASRYSAKDLSGKLSCKKDLLETFGLPKEMLGKPVIGIVSRFAAQKGFDLIEKIAPQLLAQEIVITALGAGDAKYERLFRELAGAHPFQIQRESRV